MKSQSVVCIPDDIAPPDYKIKPSDIKLDIENFSAGFGYNETAITAYNIVKFCRQKENNEWRPFTKKEIGNSLGKEFWSNRLIGKNLLVFKESRYYVTKEFIRLCNIKPP